MPEIIHPNKKGLFLLSCGKEGSLFLLKVRMKLLVIVFAKDLRLACISAKDIEICADVVA